MSHRKPGQICLALCLAAQFLAIANAQAQMQRSGVGATLGVTPPPPVDDISSRRHRSPTGAVCLRLTAVSRSFPNNDRLFNHWIYAENVCGERVRMQVCYYGTRSCIDMDVGGHERKEAILGTLPATKDFRYEYSERF
ncbi:hypothetical protein ACVIHD_006871 [Bradyrhizobium embrapense]